VTIYFGKNPDTGKTVGYSGDAHIMTVAPTGSGKGATSIIPNLLQYKGSVIVIDPKGENAEQTVEHRQNAFGHDIYVIDPFGITDFQDIIGRPPATFNPLDYIDGHGDDGPTQADRLADALIITEQGSNRYFSDEARSLLKAVILHVGTAEDYEGTRHLHTVNVVLSHPLSLLETMQENDAADGLIKRIAARMLAKAEKELSAVVSTAQSNLAQFMDDPRLQRSLSHSDFDFAQCKREKVSIYIVLPPQYLETFSRWLRLLIGSALSRLTEIPGIPELPILFILDEFAHLGHLEAVQTAYGLGRGSGIKLWVILQNLSQLDKHYGEHGKETFVANSGAIELFNMNDNAGLKYFSEKIGEHYIDVRTVNRASTMNAGETTGLSKTQQSDNFSTNTGISSSESENIQQEKRFMMLPSEIAALSPDQKLYLRQGEPHRILEKVYYYLHPVMRKQAGLKD